MLPRLRRRVHFLLVIVVLCLFFTSVSNVALWRHFAQVVAASDVSTAFVITVPLAIWALLTAFFTIHGVNVHTGSAKGILVNSQLIGMEIQSMLPDERPETTEGYEGFFHLMNINGNTEMTKMRYFVRDHSREKFEERHETLRQIAKAMNEKYGQGTVELEILESYYNMREKIEPCMHLVDIAKKAITDAGLTPDVSPVRGGTDGARLSFKGLPCPNLGTGGSAFHGPYEHITVEGMDTVVGIVEDIIKSYAVFEGK